MMRPLLKHCRACGASLAYRLPDDGDTKERAICSTCQTVHYENPLNVVGTVPFWGDGGDQVLLCKRNIEPRHGKWTLPAGFMELGEIFDGSLIEVGSSELHFLTITARLKSCQFSAPATVPQI